jgi:hypothetical protein
VKNKHYNIIDAMNIKLYDCDADYYFKFVNEMNGPLATYYNNIRAPVERQLLEDLYANPMERMD